MRREVAELAERVDFTERMLGQQQRGKVLRSDAGVMLPVETDAAGAA